MTVKAKEPKIARYWLTFETNGSSITAVLTRNETTSDWELHLRHAKEYSIKRMAEICEAVYDTKIIEESRSFWLEGIEGQKGIIINERSKILDDLINGIEIKTVKFE